jgi:hypothetical protein
LQRLLVLLHILFLVRCLLAADGILKLLCLFFADQLSQRRNGLEEVGDFGEGSEAAEAVEGSDRNGHFGLVIVICGRSVSLLGGFVMLLTWVVLGIASM